MGKFFKELTTRIVDNVENEKNTDNNNSFHKTTKEFESDIPKELDRVLEKKEYQHWGKEEHREINRKMVQDYDMKKRIADKAALMTQQSVLSKYIQWFDGENLKRIESEIGSNKIEIYNEPYFVVEKVKGIETFKVLGMRDIEDGKICVRDTTDMERLKHTASHETIHDLAHYSQKIVEISEAGNDANATMYYKELKTGLHIVNKYEKKDNDKNQVLKIEHHNRYLNEGFTELFTLEEMIERGDTTHFDSYTNEVGWAMNLRDIVGNDMIMSAYFGGKIDELINEVNMKSSYEDAWNSLNINIDAYHHTKDIKYKNKVEEILDSLQGGIQRTRRKER